MSLWAIIPVKPFPNGKSRLANVLSESERKALIQQMLANTLLALHAVPMVEGILVVSSDRLTLDLASGYGCKALNEQKPYGLNSALSQATLALQKDHVDQALILPSDLPNIDPRAINDLLSQLGVPPEILIVPDRHEKGTNALYVCPLGMIQYHFGSNSFTRHMTAAQVKGMRIGIYRSADLEFDIDSPEDLAVFQKKKRLSEFAYP
jgi:2-phospho-L-lactate guanylyltransferase